MRKVKSILTILFSLLLIAVNTAACNHTDPSKNISISDQNSSATSDTTQDRTLRILADIEATRYGSGGGKQAMPELLSRISMEDDVNIEVEYLSGDSLERQSQMVSLQTEIMAGKGPDVYIVACTSPDVAATVFEGDFKYLFPFPQSSMRKGQFLSLDEWISQSSAPEWDQLTAAIINAGKTEEGQMIVPLTFDFEMTLFNEADIDFSDSLPVTWDDAVSSGNLGLMSSCVYNDCKFGDVLGSLADYSTEQLSFTEEQLLKATKQASDMLDKELKGEFDEAPEHLSCLFSRHNARLFTSHIGEETVFNLTRDEPEIAMVPLYNVNGGVTANITSFVAIDANTDMPEEAFAVVEALISDRVQQSYFFSCVDGVPVNENTLTNTTKISVYPDDPDPWFLSESNYREYSKVRSQINEVKFYTPLDITLTEMFNSLSGKESEKELAELISQTYQTMKMELAES